VQHPKEKDMKDLFRGELVRLTAEEPEFRAKQEARWARDTEFHRLMDSDSAQLYSDKKVKEWIEKSVDEGFKPERYFFSIRALDDDQLIGFLGLWLNLIHREVWVGIGIGERNYWSKGYGTDAMKLCLQYAFMELGAQRVSLGLFEYNPRALRTYEKAGFRLEGRTRQDVAREGQRHDSLWMGVLREEWLQMQGEG
jgi:RimJ/RimL family protein N-acetyltransferase